MRKQTVIIVILLCITATAIVFMPTASATTTTYDYSSGASTNKWAYYCSDASGFLTDTFSPGTEAPFTSYDNIVADNEFHYVTKANKERSHRFTYTINENPSSIKQLYLYWKGNTEQAKTMTWYIWNFDTTTWELLGTGASSTDIVLDGTKTSSISSYIEDPSGYLQTILVAGPPNGQRELRTNYVKVDVTHTSISSVNTDKEEYSVGETIAVSWTTADCCGSGESYINIDYRDASDDTQWCLHSTSTAATSDVSCPIPSSCAGHMIDIYVYTASTDAASYTAAITEGAPWPKSTYSPVTPEFLIIAIPLLSAVAIYFLMRRSKKKGSKII